MCIRDSPHGETDVKPTRQGIALRLREWDNMKKIIDVIGDNYPTLGTALPCYMSRATLVHCSVVNAVHSPQTYTELHSCEHVG